MPTDARRSGPMEGVRWPIEARPARQGAVKSAYVQPTSGPGPEAASVQDGQPGAAGVSAEARSLHPRVHADAKEAELGFTQGGACPADQRD